MATKVGPKGQVVIEREIRSQLRVEPGMLAIQRVVDNHVEIHFVRVGHHDSLAGAARPFVRRWPSPAELEDLEVAWDDEVERFRPRDQTVPLQ